MPSFGGDPTIQHYDPNASYVVGDIVVDNGELRVMNGSGMSVVGNHNHTMNDNGHKVIFVDEDTIIQVGDEEITGKDLSMIIKLMKKQYPEVFI